MILLLLIAHVLVLHALEFAPYPELFVYPYLASSGFLPYRDILDQHFPGLMFFPVNFFSLGFTDPVSFKMLLILVVILTSLLVYKVSRSWLAVAAYTIWQPFFEGNQLWLDIFLPLFTLPGYYFFTRSYYVFAGLFLGSGVVFKQTLVPLVAYVGLTLLLSRKFKELFRFGTFALLPSVLMLLYFSSLGILPDFWFWAINFNLTAFAQGGRLAPGLTDLFKLSLPVGIVLIGLWKLPRHRFLIGWLVFTVIGGIARFGFLHLQPAVPFFALLISQFKYQRRLLALIFLLSLCWQIVFYSRQTNWGQIKYFEPAITSLVSHISFNSDPGDKIFLLGVDPHVYPLTRTLPPDRTFVFQFPWFIKVAGSRLLQTLINDPPKLVVYNPESEIDKQYLRDYALFLVEYIRSNYDLVGRQGTLEIYESRH